MWRPKNHRGSAEGRRVIRVPRQALDEFLKERLCRARHLDRALGRKEAAGLEHGNECVNLAPLLNVSEVAAVLRLSPSGVRNLLSRGLLDFIDLSLDREVPQ